MRFVSRAGVRAAFFLLAVTAVAACFPRHSDTSAEGASRRNTEVMDSTELRSDMSFSTLYDVISAKRPNWLLPRGGPLGQRVPELGVWVNSAYRTVGVDYLRNLRPADVREVRRLSTTESLHTYSWPWGGLVITLR
jgi:hypothetical protein